MNNIPNKRQELLRTGSGGNSKVPLISGKGEVGMVN